jgi:hypothetical protein
MNRTGARRAAWTCSVAGALALVAAGGASAQVSRYTAQDADDAFALLSSEVPGLRATWDFETGFPTFIAGSPIRLFGVPADLAAHEGAARQFVDVFPGLFGFDSSTLVTDQVKLLQLSKIGTTDKVAVGFTQWVGGLPVKDGSVSVLFNSDGAIVGVENKGLPNVQDLDVVPTISDKAATAIAQRAFRHGEAKVLGVEFAIVANANKSGPALAWIVELGGVFDPVAQLPLQEKFTIDAHDGGLIRRESTIHTFTDLFGVSRQWFTPGTLPDTASNPIVKDLLRRCYITSPVGNTNCDAIGKWTIVYGGSANQLCTWNYSSNSLYAWVDDQWGADYSASWTAVPGVKLNQALNVAGGEQNTAETNAQRWGVWFREWVVTLDPTDTKMNFKQRLNVNQNSSCNAYYNGSSTNYYRKLGGCNNTAYSTVVLHETGHWANDKYGSGNGYDGFGEGGADAWAIYITDQPIVGEDFYTSGGDIRTGLNTRQYCGSCGAACYGEVHADGEVLMGALWKVRDHLNITNGDAAGDAIADALFLAWFQSYNASTICQTNDDQWLTLDDDNGNLADGTPHSSDIDQGYKDQGYPGYY